MVRVPHLRREKGSFWWKDILHLHCHYRGIRTRSFVKGDTISLWDDLILNNIFLQKNPNLFSFAEEHVISLEKVLNSSDLIDLF